MERDPLRDVVDAPLFIVPRVLDALRAYRAAPKLARLGHGAPEEAGRLRAAFDALADCLLAGIEGHPSTFWVMKQCQATLQLAAGASEDARRQCGAECRRLLAPLGIREADTDAVLYFYLGD